MVRLRIRRPVRSWTRRASSSWRPEFSSCRIRTLRQAPLVERGKGDERREFLAQLFPTNRAVRENLNEFCVCPVNWQPAYRAGHAYRANATGPARSARPFLASHAENPPLHRLMVMKGGPAYTASNSLPKENADGRQGERL